MHDDKPDQFVDELLDASLKQYRRRGAARRARDASPGGRPKPAGRGAAPQVGMGLGGLRGNAGCNRSGVALRARSTSRACDQRFGAAAGCEDCGEPG